MNEGEEHKNGGGTGGDNILVNDNNLTAKPQQTKKVSYEELEVIANQASQQAEFYRQQLEGQNYANVLNRLGMLFRVVEHAEKFSTLFVSATITEIEETLTIPEELKAK